MGRAKKLRRRVRQSSCLADVRAAEAFETAAGPCRSLGCCDDHLAYPDRLGRFDANGTRNSGSNPDSDKESIRYAVQNCTSESIDNSISGPDTISIPGSVSVSAPAEDGSRGAP